MTVRDRARPALARAGTSSCVRAPVPLRRASRPRPAAGGVPRRRDVDLAAAAQQRRRPRRDRRAGPRRRDDDRLRQELRRRRRRGLSSAAARRGPARAGLRVCAWQFVYGADPVAEAAPGARAVAAGADCLVIDAETAYEGATRRRSATSPRCARSIGAGYPLGLTSFPYVDYHPRFPYSVFLAPGGRAGEPAAGLLEGHRRHGRRGERAARVAQNRIYGVADRAARPGLRRRRADRHPALPRGLGGLRRGRPVVVELAGRSPTTWSTLAPPAPAPIVPARPGLARARARARKGDQVIWLQQHLASIATRRAGRRGARPRDPAGAAPRSSPRAACRRPARPTPRRGRPS